MSIEALAIAGVDYAGCSTDIEALEHFGLPQQAPLCLLLGEKIESIDRPVKDESGTEEAASVIFSDGRLRKREPRRSCGCGQTACVADSVVRSVISAC